MHPGVDSVADAPGKGASMGKLAAYSSGVDIPICPAAAHFIAGHRHRLVYERAREHDHAHKRLEERQTIVVHADDRARIILSTRDTT
jgi:hypothetical protein